MKSTNGWALGHGRDIAKTLLLALLVFLGLGAREARANISNQVTISNYTNATLTLANYSSTATDPLLPTLTHTYNSEYWVSTDPNGVEPPCAYAIPPATINPGQTICFYVEANDSGFLNEANGAGGTVTYNVNPYYVDVQAPPLTVTWAWSTPWGSQGFQSLLEPNSWWASGAVTQTQNDSPVVGTTEYGFTVGWQDPGGQAIQFSLGGEQMTAALQSTVGAAGFTASIGGTGFNPGTSVLFNGVASPSVSCTSTLCTAVCPTPVACRAGTSA